MPRCVPIAPCALALLVTTASAAAQDRSSGRVRLEDVQRQEGEALIALADAAMTGRSVPADFGLEWHNDFLKAAQGTFVPFVVTIEADRLSTPSVLLYVRAAFRDSTVDLSRASFPFEDAYPLDVPQVGGEPARVARGFAVPPGEYDLVLVARERVDPGDPERPRKASVRRFPLAVPDFRVDALTTSSIILAHRQRPLAQPVGATELADRPYAIGLTEVEPCVDRLLRHQDELIIVYLVYNVAVTPDRTFDLEVEYHFFLDTGGSEPVEGAPDTVRALGRPGERYFNHTRPQRFNPTIMGPEFDPAAGQPIMAGQGVPLAGFPEGKYRLLIRITDIIAGRAITRDATFVVAAK